MSREHVPNWPEFFGNQESGKWRPVGDEAGKIEEDEFDRRQRLLQIRGDSNRDIEIAIAEVRWYVVTKMLHHNDSENAPGNDLGSNPARLDDETEGMKT
jgi:hypothetical protein